MVSDFVSHKGTKKHKGYRRAFFVSLCVFVGMQCMTCAQVPGDEDKEMFNRAKQRDQQAIDEAINGWWTASMRSHDKRIAWWLEAKFGMFIHWGIYSLPAGEWKGKKVSGYAEHLMRKEKISRAEYLELAHQFNPVKFNASEWILQAKNAGMRYFIITAKHHDGFALYDSKVSTFDLADQSAFKRDPLAELAAAAKQHDIKFGFYYSHAFDWEHPAAPGNDWEYNNPGGDKNLFGGTTWYDAHPELLPAAQKYVDEKAIPQITELINKYHPDILWFDTPHKLPLSENIRILKAIRQIDSNVVINGRLVRNADANFGDYKNTADRPAEFYPVNSESPVAGWEAIPTTNESYGYHKYDSSHKSVDHFVKLLASAASRGGNLLMNIGPKGDGSFDKKDRDILAGIGSWIEKNGESIYSTKKTPLPLQSWGVSTWKDNKLYLHVFDRPADGKLYVGGLKTPVSRAWSLIQRKNLSVTRLNDKDIVIDLSTVPAGALHIVIAVELLRRPETDSVRVVCDNIPVTRMLAFDARLQGKGFSFGDGKANRYFVENWKSAGQQLSWTFRTIGTGSYKIIAKYIAPAETAGGTFSLQLGKDNREQEVETGPGVQTVELLTTTIPPGIHTLTISPLKITKTELMKLLEIQLIPIKK
jgi:alpha-L-fucosidase